MRVSDDSYTVLVLKGEGRLWWTAGTNRLVRLARGSQGNEQPRENSRQLHHHHRQQKYIFILLGRGNGKCD